MRKTTRLGPRLERRSGLGHHETAHPPSASDRLKPGELDTLTASLRAWGIILTAATIERWKEHPLWLKPGGVWPFRDTAWVAIADGRIVAAGRSYQTSPTTEEEADLRRQHGEGLAVFDKPPLVEDAGVGVKR